MCHWRTVNVLLLIMWQWPHVCVPLQGVKYCLAFNESYHSKKKKVSNPGGKVNLFNYHKPRPDLPEEFSIISSWPHEKRTSL